MASLKKNFLYSIGYQILVIILPLITAPYVTRVLGTGAIGEYSYKFSVATYFSLMAMLGISQHGNRAISECGDKREKRSINFWSIYIIQFISHLIVLVTYCFYLCLSNNTNVISILQIFVLISSMFDISWLFFGMENFKITVLRNTVIKVLTVILIFTLVKNPSDLWKYTLILGVGTFISQVYLWVYIKKYVDFIVPTCKSIKLQVKPIFILVIPVIAYSIYKVMDKIMLGIFSSYDEVAVYEYAYKINNIPISLITAIGNVMLPRMTSLVASGEKNDFDKYIKNTFYLVNFVSAALIFGIAGISSNFAIVYYGQNFSKCGSLMVCLNWTVFFIAWANIMRTQYLIPNRKDKIYVTSTVVGAVCNLIINLLLIGPLKSMGASIGTLIAEFMVMFIQAICIRKEQPVFRYIGTSYPYYILGFIMMIIVGLVGNLLGVGFSTLIIQIIIGGVIYLFGAIMISLYRKDLIYLSCNKWIRKRTIKRSCNGEE